MYMLGIHLQLHEQHCPMHMIFLNVFCLFTDCNEKLTLSVRKIFEKKKKKKKKKKKEEEEKQNKNQQHKNKQIIYCILI